MGGGQKYLIFAVVCLVLGFITYVALQVYLYFNPADRVKVSITNMPRGVTHVSFAVESGGQLRPLNWSPRALSPLSMHPAGCPWSIHDPEATRLSGDRYVRWIPGDQYGVVTRTVDGEWHVTWFKARELPLKGKEPVLGGGEVSFDFSRGTTEPLTTEQLMDLGLQPADENANKEAPA